MKAIFIKDNINESNFASKFRAGMSVQTKTNKYHIAKVEDYSSKFDILHVTDIHGNKKMISSKWMEENGTIIPKKREIEKTKTHIITTQQYMREIKDIIHGLRQSVDDIEDPYSYIYDSAESLIYDDNIYNYLVRKYKKEYGQSPKKQDLIDMLTNDISNNYQ
jgi:hypothetical protein